ncbi:MAG: Crp/Fnr family transcriptional regulator [Arenicellales bacterium]
MTHDIITQRLHTFFPTLHAALPQLPASIYQLVTVPSNTTIFDIGSQCEQYLLLTQGSVNVKMTTKNGKTISLYRVTAGQSCVITTACLLGNQHYPSTGESETDIEALSVSHTDFNHALAKSVPFRQFVFDSLGHRLSKMMARIETINFTSIDNRVASTLLSLSETSPQINITHEAFAEEIGTAREVVSRHLKKLEAKHIIEMHRGQILIKDIKQLNALCD